MNLFSKLKGQHQAKKILVSAVSSNRLAHAYILAGPDGSGRLTAALDLAKARICPEQEKGFCGECKQCRQIDSMVHPDVRITLPKMKTTKGEEVVDLINARAKDGITPLRFQGNTYISIDQMREMSHRLSRKSFEGYGYVEIIYDAHRLRREAANAILKTLEEPPDGALLILITSRVSGLLPTVRSRAHTVRFGRLTTSVVKELLMERVGVSAETASRLALLSDGSPGLALELSRKKAKEKSKAEDVLKLIFSKSLGDMELATEMDVMSRKMGREGILVLCGEMTSLIHDMRRAIAGSRPLAREIVPDVVGADDESYRRMEKLFLLCEKRMRANVSPSMAFSTAAVSSRKRGA
ncbi:MAG: DNA polymerase III subunit [Candidatus Sabulitectum sp.]|nr:DNA polymerase III subunit [Candidatus Sabulitectum sp.]